MAEVSEMIPVTLEAAEKEPMIRGRWEFRRASSRDREVDVAIGILFDLDHLGDRLPPRSSFEWCS